MHLSVCGNSGNSSGLTRSEFLLDALVLERVNLRFKDVAEAIRKTTSFEASVLASGLNAQIETLKGILFRFTSKCFL